MPNLVLNSVVIPLLAQAVPAPAPGGEPGGASGLGLGMLWPLLMLAAMWFLMIAPQNKKRKEHQRMVAALASGDDIVTSGGIFGTVTNVKPDRLVVKIADNTKIEIERSCVARVEKKSE